jgi:RNA polymerase sigma-70 factor (ECF subfamily)
MMTSAFESEALPLVPAVNSFARQLCSDEDRAWDLTQETMLKAFLSSTSYKEGTNCRAWLFQICKNSFINQYRWKQRQPARMEYREEPDPTGSARDAVSGDEIHELSSRGNPASPWEHTFGDEVTQALASIPWDYQLAIVLCDIEGYTYHEIAELTDAPIGTIRSRIHRGRKMLAALLIEYARGLGLQSDEATSPIHG